MLSPFETLHSGKAYLIRSSYDAPMSADPSPRAREEGYVWSADAADQSPCNWDHNRLIHMDPALGASDASTALLRSIA